MRGGGYMLKKWSTLFFTLAFSLAFSMLAFAADDVSLTGIASDIVTSISGDLIAAVGIVVTGIIGFFTIKIGISKVMSFVKSMIGKA